jgi:hypothetical protein
MITISTILEQLHDPVLFYASKHRLKDNQCIILVLADRRAEVYQEPRKQQLFEPDLRDNILLQLKEDGYYVIEDLWVEFFVTTN